MHKTDERAALTSQVLALAPSLTRLDDCSLAQLREMLTNMHAQRDRYAALGFVDESAPAA